MNFDSQEPQPNLALRASASLMGLVSLLSIVFIPKDEWGAGWGYYAIISVCLVTAGLFFTSSADEKRCGKGWIGSLFLGIVWLFNAAIHLLLAIASNLPKTE